MVETARPVALVTGGTSGIGRATAIALGQAGYDVIATGLLAGEIAGCRADPEFKDIRILQLDIADEKAVARLFSGLGRLDVLVNAAGVSRVTDEFTGEGFRQILDINLHGTMRCCYAARPLLAQRGGAIVNVASTMSFVGSATAPAYAASKGAIVQFTKSLALAWAPQSVRCNAVAPGWIDTPMTAALQADHSRYQRVLSRTPLGRLGRATEVAQGILFLASQSASFITGAVLPVDGGYLAHGI